MRRSKEDAEQTRISILDAAERLFCHRGVNTTSLEQVARAAKVTRGAVYWHFKDKADLLLALRNRYWLPQEKMIEEALADRHPDPFGLLLETGAQVLGLFEEDEGRQRFFVIMAEANSLTDEASPLYQANCDMFGVLSGMMRLARENGDLSDEFTPEEAAVYMMVAMNGLVSEWLRSRRAFPLKTLGAKLLRSQVELLRHHVAAPRAAG